MPQIRTLNEMVHLKQSNFGRCWPRHGLNLLYWFAHDCLELLDNRMSLRCVPSNQDYGFREFHNREDTDGFLLPQTDLTYYEVGNLNFDRANELPEYVQMHYGGYVDGNNKDRIIVSVDDWGWLHDIYVTEHKSKFTFSRQNTYCISKDLLRTIRSMERSEFLQRAGYQGWSNNLLSHNQSSTTTPLDPTPHRPARREYSISTEESPSSWCTIL